MSATSVDHAISSTYAIAFAVRDVRSHSVASLSLLVWHSLLSLDEDVRYIWTMPNKSPFKWVYFFLRYVVILAHVMHNILMGPLADGSNPPVLCTLWYAYVVALSQILSSMLEFVLASRVYALYNRSRRVALLLATLILTEFAWSVRAIWTQHAMEFYGTCLLMQVNEGGRDGSIVGFTVHCMLISLALFKYFIARRAGWGRTPLVSLVIRDGAMVYATTTFILVSVVIMCGVKNERAVAIFFWVTMLLSISGCRVILSMARLASGEMPTESCPPVFTSEINMGTLDSGMRHDRAAA